MRQAAEHCTPGAPDGRVAVAQTPAPAIDLEALSARAGRAFGLFASLPFEQKRELLRRAIRDIVIDGGTFPSLRVRGGFSGGDSGV